jgi:sorbitol-specific phosphotransferase system component IIBC
MKHVASASTRSVIIIRWLARIIGTLSIAIFLFLFVAEIVEKGRIDVESDRIIMTVFMFLAFIGLIIAWKWEGLGGAMALGGLIAFNILAPASPFKGGLLVVTGLYGLPALLFVFCWWQTKKQLNPKAT